jgi:hypothetical protein
MSSIFNSFAQPDVDRWDEKIQSSIADLVKPKVPVSSGCDWMPPYLIDIAENDQLRSVFDISVGVEYQNLLGSYKGLVVDAFLRKDVVSLNFLKNNDFLKSFLYENPTDALDLLNVRNSAWEGYGFLNDAHKRRFDRQWQRYLEETNSTSLFNLYESKFTLLKKDKELREEILGLLVGPSNNVLTELKRANIFHGNYITVINGQEISIPFISFSSSSAKLLNKFVADGISEIDGKLIIPRPPANDSPDRFVKVSPGNENRAFDAEISLFDYWMKDIYEQTNLDWRQLADKDEIISLMIAGEFNSFMSPCPSCSSVIQTFFDSDNIDNLVDWGINFLD